MGFFKAQSRSLEVAYPTFPPPSGSPKEYNTVPDLLIPDLEKL